MLTPNTDGVPVTRHSEAAKAEMGVRLSAVIAKIDAEIEDRMLTSLWPRVLECNSPDGLTLT